MAGGIKRHQIEQGEYDYVTGSEIAAYINGATTVKLMEKLTALGPGDNQANWVDFIYSPPQPSESLGTGVSETSNTSTSSFQSLRSVIAPEAQHHAKFQMSSAAAAPNTSLIAILLVIQDRTGSGSRLVFHYPPDPLNHDDAALKSLFGSLDIYESSSTSSDDSLSEDDLPTPRKDDTKSKAWNGTKSWSTFIDEDEVDAPAKTRSGFGEKGWEPSWEPLLGLGTDGLVGLLTPDRTWHKRRFEVGINDFCFLGWPVFAKEDGTWRRQKLSPSTADPPHNVQIQSETATTAREAPENTDEHESFGANDSARRKPKKSDLTMFNVVFVLDPPILDHVIRVKDMYDHVVKKLTKALKWEQGRSEYVLKEAELIQSIESKHFSEHSPASVMYTELLARSTLATAISTVFTSISTSRIASITLSPSTSISLQIPPVTFLSEMPSLTDPPAQAGLWLTTVNDQRDSSDIDSAAQSSPLQLAKKFTLLLNSTKQRILKDVQTAGGPLAMPLSNFVLATDPTKSFHKISLASKISLADIQLLARHLVYWRRAIAIPPLNQRDTYVVSPNANLNKLKAASKAYESAFPTLPSLPVVLAKLSETPKPWGFLIPSTDHKEAYYEVLAWLMRGGWVTQLRTFANVRIDPEVKKAVRDKEAAEETERKTFGTASNGESDSDDPEPLKRPGIIPRSSGDAKLSTTSTANSSNHSPGTKSKPDNPNLSTLIINPMRATPLESAWLDYIADSLLTTDYSAQSLSDEEKQDLRRSWPVFLRYFDGQQALESIPVREGLKRKVVWEILGRMGLGFDNGVEKEDGRKGWLVTVRHW